MHGQPILSVSTKVLSFNKSCISKLPDTDLIELLILPGKGMIAVRKAPAGSHTTFLWRKTIDGENVPRLISGNAFLPTLYSLFSWNRDCQYKMSGTVHSKDGETVLLFNTREAVLLYEDISTEEADPVDESSVRKRRRRKGSAFPSDWADSFGEDYYTSQGGQFGAGAEVEHLLDAFGDMADRLAACGEQKPGPQECSIVHR